MSQKIGWSQLAGKISNQMNSDELLQFQLENGIITPNQYQAYKLHGANTDWQKYFFDNAAPMYNTDFSMRGGSETTTYFVSASYMKQNNLTRVGHFNRYTLRSNLDTKPKSWLNFGLKQSVVYTDRRAEAFASGNKIEGNTSNPVVSAFMYAPYWDPYSEKQRRRTSSTSRSNTTLTGCNARCANTRPTTLYIMVWPTHRSHRSRA